MNVLSKKTVAVISNDPTWTYNLRGEILDALLKAGCRVVIIDSYGKKADDLKNMGCEFIDVPMNRHGLNPINEYRLLRRYKKILSELKPDFVLTYTIKPNTYGGYVCGKLGIPYIANITGLGTALENKGPLQKFFLFLLKNGLKKASMVFFQNTENMQFLLDNKVISGRYSLIPGSGVNVKKFEPQTYPDGELVEFVFISRIMKEKGADQYLEAAEYIRKKYPNTRFHVCGFCEGAYDERISELNGNGTIIYHGMVDDIREIHKITHCTVHPTYYPEGMSNVLLESAASARPIITTDRSGCREIIDDGVNGYVIRQRDSQDLIEKLERFIALSQAERREMGLRGREKVEREFDRQIVVDAYLKEIGIATVKEQVHS